MALSRSVEGGGDDLPEPAMLHVGDLFRALLHEKDHEMAFRVVLYDSLGHRLEDGGLPGLGGGNDHGSLALAERAEEIDDPVGGIGLATDRPSALQDQGLIGVLSSQLREHGPSRKILRRNPIHPHQAPEGSALPVLRPGAHLPIQLVPSSEVELLDDAGSDVDIVLSGGIGNLTTPYEARPTRKYFQDAQGSVICHELITIVGRVQTWSPGSYP
jgi:hypothetical protein